MSFVSPRECPRDRPHLLCGLLAARGYAAADVEGFMHGNVVEFLRRALPA